MTSRRDSKIPTGLQALLRAGTGVGLTDGQLLECFATRETEAAELAFAVLVERHGPMVLRTCLGILRDEHDARDAFQAAFLILARRGGSLWVRDSIGPWLHRVARHAAIRARQDAARRRSVEQGAWRPSDRPPDDVGDSELAALVHEEVDRLPERYRIPVVLCELEGRTLEEAARHLGCPVGTVKSRLSRARERLRDRLTRRGLAAEDLAVGSLRPALPPGLAEATASAVFRPATAGAGAVTAAVARDVMRSMFLAHLRGVTVRILVGIAIGTGLFLYGAGVPTRQLERGKPSDAPGAGAAKANAPGAEAAKVDAPARPAPEYAW